MGRTFQYQQLASFVADPRSIRLNTGRQIDWTNVNASYKNSLGNKVIPAGTVMGELLSTNGSISPRIVTTNPATCILMTDAVENSLVDSLSGYGCTIGGVLYENLLPDSSGSPRVLPTADKTELATAGCTFQWEVYSDIR